MNYKKKQVVLFLTWLKTSRGRQILVDERGAAVLIISDDARRCVAELGVQIFSASSVSSPTASTMRIAFAPGRASDRWSRWCLPWLSSQSANCRWFRRDRG